MHFNLTNVGPTQGPTKILGLWSPTVPPLCNERGLHVVSSVQISLNCKATDTAGLAYHAACQFTPKLSLVLIAPTHMDCQAELTRVAG